MTIDDTTGGDPDARAAAEELLKDGEATISDAARLAGVDRRVVHYWAKAAKINVAEARDRHLAKRWRAKLGKKAAKRKITTQAEQRKAEVASVGRFNTQQRRRKK